jgi:MFS superfamily sulfate permease-like transporter
MKIIFRNIKRDLPASIVVFFVALPLCLGIALASGAPLFSGIIAGIVGGIVVGFASNSALGVSGPAAGLATIVFSYIATLGGNYQAFLLSVVVAGLIQIIAGFLRCGSIAYYFPSSVIKGMLAGIGLIIILKQVPHALGYDLDTEGDFFFHQSNGETTFSQIGQALNFITPAAIIISTISLMILILWETNFAKRHKFFKIIQAPLLVVALGILLCVLFQNQTLPFSLNEKQLVKLPVSAGISGFLANFILPDFSYLTNPKIYMMGFVIALVASIETLLSVEAIDKIDPYKRITPTNRELKAQGLGNIISGLLGGLPITQVIVRSSANAAFGAKTKDSTILHGFFLLIAVIAIPGLLNMVPLASLACILLLVGYKLTKPKLYFDVYKLGFEQFLPFVTTIISMLLTDLLTGVGVGMAVALLFVLYNNFRNSYQQIIDSRGKNNEHIIRLAEEVSFLNKGAILQLLKNIPNRSKVIIDGSSSKYIHNDIVEIIDDFQVNSRSRQINLEVRGAVSTKHYVSAISKEKQRDISPQKAIEMLKEGNKRFVSSLNINRNLLNQVNETSDTQNPFAFVLSCIDSRTSAELIFDQGLGDIFSCRIAGNILNQDIVGSMEFASKVVGVKLIMVLGHSGCGAIKGACDHVEMGNLTNLLHKIHPAISAETNTLENRDSSNEKFVENVSAINVKLVMEEITKHSPIIAELLAKKEIAIIGGMYNVMTGEVEFY